MNTSNNNLADFIKDFIAEIIYRIRENRRIVVPVAAVTCVFIIVAIALHSSGKKKDSEGASEENALSSSSAPGIIVDVPEVQLMKNAYPSVNSLIEKYYDAMAAGDMVTIMQINNNVDETEKLRLEKMSSYIDKYEHIDVYTKLGPVANSYIAYVYAEVKFKDYSEALPGMQVYYVCTGEDGTLYINEKEQEENITNYIREVSLQSDVVDLNNKVSVAYNDMLSADPDLAAYLVQLTQDIDNAVGEELAAIEGTQSTPLDSENIDVSSGGTGSQSSAGTGTSDSAGASQTTTTPAAGTKVKATTVVNIRSSDSETADKLGKAQKGQEFVLKQEKANGWSEVEYNGGSAYIKSDYLTKVETENTDAGQQANANANNSGTQAGQSASTSSSTKQATVKASGAVNVRKSPSTDGAKLGSVYNGETLKVIEKRSDGWTEVEYKGSNAFVKSDYLTF